MSGRPWLSGWPHQRTSCEVRIRLVDRQHAPRRTKIVWFARHLERIKSDEVLALVRALRTCVQSVWRVGGASSYEGKPILTVHSWPLVVRQLHRYSCPSEPINFLVVLLYIPDISGAIHALTRSALTCPTAKAWRGIGPWAEEPLNGW